ncbi:hypothetical protein [Streptomyces sp. NBC_01294]|uniref:Orn/Lys/Arg family decarboxylase n=1 Tax=Streptomyces sp. NBC_01294 TaxID=2903815 RepID=UPI002DDC876E|nr:hypothetical protein [Streptomyces sp. NBC_01294]WRZ55780.1 hypothetical protein OG534_04395 [Streptomyces sp. NBC_01294]
MPGESTGAPDWPLLRYLRALEAFDRAFPGFPQRGPRGDRGSRERRLPDRMRPHGPRGGAGLSRSVTS